MSDGPGCILVMGMHRSGTSCVGALLDAMGVSLGPKSALMKPTPDNPLGYFENIEFNRLLIDLLEETRADWWKIRDFDVANLPERAVVRARSRLKNLLSQFDDGRIFALKDPRLCLLLPALRPVFPDPVFLHVVRSPVEVAMSLNKRNGFGLAEGVALWEAYNRHAIAATAGEPRLLVDYADLVVHAESAAAELVENLRALGARGLEIPEPAVLLAVVSRELHRQKADKATTEGFLTESQKRFWEQFEAGQFPDLEETSEAGTHRRMMLTCLEAQATAQRQRSEDAKKEVARKDVQESIAARAREIAEVRETNRQLGVKLEDATKKIAEVTEANRLLGAKLEDATKKMQDEIAGRRRENRELKVEIQSIRSEMVQKQNKLEAILLKATHKPSLMCKLRRSLSRAKYRWDNRKDPERRSLLDRINRDFDRNYYYAMYADVRSSCIDPRVHFLKYGWKENRKPHPKRSAEDLLARYPEIGRRGAAAAPAAVHSGAESPMRSNTEAKARSTADALSAPPAHADSPYWATRLEVLGSDFWDERWYLRHHYAEYNAWRAGRTADAAPVDHFLQVGAMAGYEPSPLLKSRRAYAFKDLNPVSAFLHRVQPNFHFDENIWFPDPETVASYMASRAKRVSKKVVYTCNLEDYDLVMQPYVLDPEWDYVLFTDDERLISQGHAGVWEVRPALSPELPPARRNRFHKVHPHLLFPDHEESIYIDANVNIISSFIFDEVRSRNLPILLSQHFGRICVYDEIEALLRSPRTSGENRQLLPQQRDFLSAMGLPRDYGLTENNIVYRRHHDATIVRMMDLWWDQIAQFSSRDQVSMSYVLWKEGIAPKDVSFPPARLLNKDFWIVAHKAEQQPNPIKVQDKITPAFDKHAVTVVLSSNESFVGYLGVAIASIVDNANDQRNYDIIILEKDIFEASKERIGSLSRKNVSIRFYNMTPLLSQLEHLDVHVEGYVPAETYNKIFLGAILEGYDRVLYFDTDIVIRKDIAELHDTNLFGKALGASPNIANIQAARLNREIKGRKFGDYLRDELGIEDFSHYFQAGIILLDLSSDKARNLLELSLQKLKEIRQPVFFDQCIFNSIFDGDVHYVSTTWNHVWYLQDYAYLRHSLDDGMFFDYARGRVDPAIVHYASKDKPTNKFDWRLSSHFWRYASQSPFADELLQQAKAASGEAGLELSSPERLTVEPPPRLLVHLHAYYEDQLPYMLGKLENIHGVDWDLVVTTSAADDAPVDAVRSRFANAEVMRVKNQGFDIYPFLKVLKAKSLSKYQYVLKLHTKGPRPDSADSKVYGLPVPGHTWRNELVDALLGSPETFSQALALMEEDPGTGCVAAEQFIFSINENRERENYDLRNWMNRFKIDTGEHYVGGTMFLARAYPFERLKAVNPDELDFESGSSTSRSHKNLAHAFERLCGLVVEGERLSLVGRRGVVQSHRAAE